MKTKKVIEFYFCENYEFYSASQFSILLVDSFSNFFPELLALQKKLSGCAGSGWDGVKFVHGILYGAGFWICG